MFQQMVAVYQRISQSVTRARRSVALNVVVLEERATPTVADGLLPIHPPETVVVSTMAPAAGPVLQPITSAQVRSDLFGPGTAGKPEQASEWDDMLVADHVAEDVSAEKAPAPDADAALTDATASVEEMFVPYVE